MYLLQVDKLAVSNKEKKKKSKKWVRIKGMILIRIRILALPTEYDTIKDTVGETTVMS